MQDEVRRKLIPDKVFEASANVSYARDELKQYKESILQVGGSRAIEGLICEEK